MHQKALLPFLKNVNYSVKSLRNKIIQRILNCGKKANNHLEKR
ncbi:hypothetical protein EHW99_3492 [Erwinia amylovora]|uniref:Uncharacterized protein n=3 Tax=Erwinia amylovora TaxID=552 RepID=A0A831A743_ERWAM|nr:hypothetical protein EaACW_3564 [Erwinia amylovora ACW56400]QJQ56191.1 hypothetical protein EHX00_3492 [Erwinia amylovora]CBA23860.1 hypothetical protein predicted by Glimmer/Critica [Erwinia amylovora CFBP1430]CBX82425.1 hypothetical protein predicted by Glimmer/Critica [Erwinia amylovora ATCC BAA-2158]CCO84209.1 hypothetical protein BN433_3664 [Erwinia amylovora Ea266]CCO87968.1 hypothetical protein BN434_3610 [Erwinia amylovora CFBP 2585]CCO91757.1 hypothetical protein BN435_3616 [Erwin